MDELLRLVLDESKQLSQLIQPEDYERFERFVETRQLLTVAVEQKGDLTQQEKRLIREILQYDPIIMRHMQSLKDEAMQGLNRLNASKKQKAAYNTSGFHESIMFNKRK
ncbi:hypothetical protein [Cohnella luojiensis]|uniref:Flagellar protein FliT n=1 Tax=Cohnella luojiensis TaxID=652876 RepID=A0A4Y8M363_9BACL|nr:hypothetical protein [Cohnella luojiensis]TFE29035.1 hypothetical protein E2980_06515 [Cohnella luojiensis]